MKGGMEKGFEQRNQRSQELLLGGNQRTFIVYKYNILYDEYMCVYIDSVINVIAKKYNNRAKREDW